MIFQKKRREKSSSHAFSWLKREGQIPPPPGYRFCITQETPISIPSRSLARSLKRNCKNVKNEPPRLFLSLSLRLHSSQLSLPPLLRKNLSANRQHPLKPLPSLLRILLEPLHTDILNRALNLLPPAAQRHNPRLLLKHRLGVILRIGSIHHLLMHRQQVTPRHILTAHGHFLRRGIHVGDFVDLGGLAAAEEGFEPLRRRLATGDEAFGAEDSCGAVERARERVDGDHVRGLVVPRAVFPPVARADFVPGVGVGVSCAEDFHGECGVERVGVV